MLNFKKISLCVLLFPGFLFSAEIVDYKVEHKAELILIAFEDPEDFIGGYKLMVETFQSKPDVLATMVDRTRKEVVEGIGNPLKDTFVLLEDKKVAGFVTLFRTREQCMQDFPQNPDPAVAQMMTKQFKEMYPHMKDTPEECEQFAKIESLAVSRLYRRKGYGRQLMECALTRIKEKWPLLDKVELDVAEHLSLIHI